MHLLPAGCPAVPAILTPGRTAGTKLTAFPSGKDSQLNWCFGPRVLSTAGKPGPKGVQRTVFSPQGRAAQSFLHRILSGSNSYLTNRRGGGISNCRLPLKKAATTLTRCICDSTFRHRHPYPLQMNCWNQFSWNNQLFFLSYFSNELDAKAS